MERLNELKLKNTCKKEGRVQEYQYYKECKESIQRDINMYQGYVDDPNKRNEISRWKEVLEQRKLELKFVRPNKKEDIDYRESQLSNNKFINELQSSVSPNLDLRFHGTPIYFAEQIIRSGEISSTADRYDGYMKSTDMAGEISASTLATFPRTLNFFSDMVAYQRSMPAGCIFALFPKDKEDATYGIDILHSVNFKENPEQLFGIFTTPENIGMVKEWMNESGLSSNLVYTFEEFLETVKEKSNIIDSNKEKQSFEDNSEENAKNVSRSYLFNTEDAKDMAMKKGKSSRRVGNILKLYSKLKETIKEKREKLNKKEEKDEISRD